MSRFRDTRPVSVNSRSLDGNRIINEIVKYAIYCSLCCGLALQCSSLYSDYIQVLTVMDLGFKGGGGGGEGGGSIQ